MSDRLEQAIDELAEKLDIIDTKLEFLVARLPQEDFKELQQTVREIKERAWERRMGEDL